MKKNFVTLLIIASLCAHVWAASETVTEIKTVKDYESLVTKSTTPLVIDFYATWCNPCKRMSPIFEKVSKNYEGKVRFVKIDTDNDNLSSIIQKFNIRSIPTFIFKKGREEKRFQASNESALRRVIDSMIAD